MDGRRYKFVLTRSCLVDDLNFLCIQKAKIGNPALISHFGALYFSREGTIHQLVTAGTSVTNLAKTIGRYDLKHGTETRLVWMFRLLTPRLLHNKDLAVLRLVFHQVVYHVLQNLYWPPFGGMRRLNSLEYLASLQLLNTTPLGEQELRSITEKKINTFVSAYGLHNLFPADYPGDISYVPSRIKVNIDKLIISHKKTNSGIQNSKDSKEGKSSLEANKIKYAKKYIEECIKWKTFGTTLFRVLLVDPLPEEEEEEEVSLGNDALNFMSTKLLGSQAHGSKPNTDSSNEKKDNQWRNRKEIEHYLGIKYSGIIIMKGKERKIFFDHRYEDLEWGIDKSRTVVFLKLHKRNTTEYAFASHEAQNIIDLIQSYAWLNNEELRVKLDRIEEKKTSDTSAVQSEKYRVRYRSISDARQQNSAYSMKRKMKKNSFGVGTMAKSEESSEDESDEEIVEVLYTQTKNEEEKTLSSKLDSAILDGTIATTNNKNSDKVHKRIKSRLKEFDNMVGIEEDLNEDSMEKSARVSPTAPVPVIPKLVNHLNSDKEKDNADTMDKATKIQSLWRGQNVRSKLDFLEKDTAARVIQRTYAVRVKNETTMFADNVVDLLGL
eukprot:g875.t1